VTRLDCRACNSQNPEDKKFCSQCGNSLVPACPNCGAEYAPQSRFCGDCGAKLSQPSTPIASPESVPALTSANLDKIGPGERRHLTVLFCDLVNSTEIAAQLDPEEWRDIAGQYQQTAAEAVKRLGGYVAKYLGDGLMVYFGWPEAHEDDAERAARSGLAIVEAVAVLTGQLAGYGEHKLSVRVGIDTGAVVVDFSAGREPDVFGDTPILASRVQAVAAPDTVVVTASVYQLVSGLFEIEDRGAHQLKGIARPVQLYRILRPLVGRRRTYGGAGRASTPFVGRDDETRLLLSRWDRARSGEGQLVLIVGEPGIGKSRLLEEFRSRIDKDARLWIECAGEQFAQSTPFHAVTHMLEQSFGWTENQSSDDRASQLERSLELAGMKLGEALPLIAELLNLPVPPKYSPLVFAPEQKRRRLMATLVTWVLNATRMQPVVIVTEDLHWADPSTLELMQTLAEQAATTQLMLLYTARPEFRVPWPLRAHHSQITLNRLDDNQTREVIAAIAVRVALSKDVVEILVKRTDGVPLFAEELTRLMLGDRRALAGEIPTTLHDSLMARIDRLGAAKEVAQVGAVLGREFSHGLLQAVTQMPEPDLQLALTKLADAELIYVRGLAPEATYQFKHVLIQDAAYEALLKARRRELHRRTAQIIIDNFPSIAQAQPEVLARHWKGAGEIQLTIDAWKQAGDAALKRQAFKEAGIAYKQALLTIEGLPESPDRDKRELDLCRPYVQALQLTAGYNAPETLSTAARAVALAEKNDSLGQHLLLLLPPFSSSLVSGDYRSAAIQADHLLELAEREGNPPSLALAHRAQVQVRFYRGEMDRVEHHFGLWRGLLSPAELNQVPAAFVVTLGMASLTAWITGRADQARERMAEVAAFADESQNRYDLAFGKVMEALLYRFLGDAYRSQDAAAKALAISQDRSFLFCRDLSLTILGWANMQLDASVDGLSMIREGLAGLLETGIRVTLTDALSRLAQGLALRGMFHDALSTIEDALEANPEEGVFRADTLATRAKLRLHVGENDNAEADLRASIALSRQAGAKTFELRAATLLAGLLQSRGQRVQALDCLLSVYNTFTEGLDTADLSAAKTAISELSLSR
jgi:class 3 adenylate cyclase